MAQSVVAISSTPRPKGNSDIFLDSLIEGCREKGAIVEKIRLRDLAISPCIGCDGCQDSVESPCVIEDDMAKILASIRNCDAMVLASPIYFASVNAHMKIMLDRLYALFGNGDFATLSGKRLAIALTYGDNDPLKSGAINAVRMFQDAAEALDIDLVGYVHCACLQAGEILDRPEALAQATALGRTLVDPPV